MLTPRPSVTGEKAKELKGSMVDKEGDVLDAVSSIFRPLFLHQILTRLVGG